MTGRRKNPPAKLLGHAYWLPGAEGVALEGLLEHLVQSQEPLSLTIEKTKNDAGRWVYSFKIDKP
jgi:hypothetical protein